MGFEITGKRKLSFKFLEMLEELGVGGWPLADDKLAASRKMNFHEFRNGRGIGREEGVDTFGAESRLKLYKLTSPDLNYTIGPKIDARAITICPKTPTPRPS